MSTEQPRITHIFISRQRDEPMIALEQAEIIADWGLAGHRKSRPGSKRQIYLVDEATLASVDLHPGDLTENFTVRGMDVNALREGQRLRIGTALLEITGPCTVCGHLELIRPGLKEALSGRRGVLARALESGTVRVGDTVEVV